MFRTEILIVCFMLLCTSCSGKSNIKTKQQEEAVEIKPNSTERVDLEMFYSTDTDRILFDDYIAHIEPFKSYPISDADLIIETAQFFLDKPYAASTLEMEPEGLVVNLREFDCTTLVETVLALSCVVKTSDNPTFENFCRQLQNIRYRRGFIGNYTDRNHYFSDWVFENEIRGYVKDVTKDIGGESYKLDLNFMSSHPDRYNQLKSSPEYIEVIREKEVEISGRDSYSIITEESMSTCEEGMQNGDIVCFVTDVGGLDISHVGFIYRDKGQLTFIHASTSAGKVVVNPQPLSAYVKRNKLNVGIMVVRPLLFR